MDLLAIIGLLLVIYTLVYIICPWFLDCDIHLAFNEKFGKPISSLSGKVVWITGASSGIGEHLAYVLADAGCKLILSARREAELERVKATCMNGNPCMQSKDVEVIPFDICNENMHEFALNEIISKFGKLDILVNNAGRSQRAEWEKINVSVDRELFEVDVFSQIALSRLVAKHFLKAGQGHFVVTSSIAGVNPVPFSASYCGAKHALHGYYYTFGIEKVGKPIAITLVCPGPIQTNFLAESFTDKVGEKYGINTEVSDRKVKVERCAQLMAVAIANEMMEVWICHPLVLQIVYFVKYFPNVGPRIILLLGAKFLLRLRDSRDSIKQVE